MDKKEYTTLKNKKLDTLKKYKNNFNRLRLIFKIIVLLIIMPIIYIIIKYIKKDDLKDEKKLFSTIQKETINESKIEKNFFLKYKEEIESKNEEFENNLPITVNTIKNILLKNSNNNDDINNNTNNIINILNISNSNISQENKNINSQETKKQDSIRYIKKLLNETFDINNLKKYNMSINPKISVIVTAYNGEKYIKNIHRSIQDQSFEDIEIIYVDDCSTDKTEEIIKSFQEIDNRIVYLKNKKNRGPFYSRNKGALFARGEFIQFIDIDDLLLNNILDKTYKIAKSKQVDIVQYAVIRGVTMFKVLNEKYTNKELIKQPELSDQMFYGRGFLRQANLYIYNKLIRKEKFYKSLIYIGDDTLKENLYTQEDAMSLFCLLRVSDSLIIIEEIGYGYLLGLNSKSLFCSGNDKNYANKYLHDNFVELRLLFKKTENNEHDKGVCIDFFQIICNLHSKLAPFVTKGYELFDEVFNLLLECPYYNEWQKNKFNILKKSIMTNRYLNKTIN